ncbi:MAG: TetR/AcrR family transcriptional regulator [Candidatus Neomarinimicrobiota bacterium]
MEKKKNIVDKKTQILYAAIEIFAKKGLERGKIADIAKQAGIGKGTIYEYFKSKDEIFSAIENLFVNDSITQVEQLINSKKSPTEKIEEMANYNINIHEAMGDAIIIFAEMWAQHSRGQWYGHRKSVFADMYTNYHKAIREILTDGIEIGEFREMNKDGVATMLLALIDGILWQSVIFKNVDNFGQWKSEAIKSFINGIKK